jgi:hypothetical protein
MEDTHKEERKILTDLAKMYRTLCELILHGRSEAYFLSARRAE